MYRMPAEYQPHRGTMMIWPVRPGSWGRDPSAAQAAFLRVFEAVTQSEELYLLAGPDHLEEAKAAAEEYKRKWYSVTAEYDNYRKRTASTRAAAYAEGRADVVGKLFPVADNLERALLSCGDEKTHKGIEMVLQAFQKILEDEKIAPIDPVGQPFDPEKCEAIMASDPEEGEESGIVKQVFVKGYEQNGKVLRYAQVLVTK